MPAFVPRPPDCVLPNRSPHCAPELLPTLCVCQLSTCHIMLELFAFLSRLPTFQAQAPVSEVLVQLLSILAPKTLQVLNVHFAKLL